VLLIVVVTNKTSLFEKGPEQDAAESDGAALAAIGHVAAAASGSTGRARKRRVEARGDEEARGSAITEGQRGHGGHGGQEAAQ